MTLNQLATQVFDLAEQFKIPTTTGQERLASEEEFLEFSQEYLLLTGLRDDALKRHLEATPTLFRVFLPYNERVYSLAQQIMWYLDEVVVRDPTDRVLRLDGLRPDQRRTDITRALALLS